MSVKSTRNTKLNYYITDNTILNSIVSISANKKQSNITLLEYNDAIQLTGKDINDDAAKNKTIYDYIKNGKPIDTGITSEQEKDIFYVYGSPHKWVLDNHQQYNNCGVDSALNVLVMAGEKTITNQNKVETEFTKHMVLNGYADDEHRIGVLNKEDGATEPTDISDILYISGVGSDIYYIEDGEHEVKKETATLDDITDAIKNGGAAIVAVHSELLWYREYKDYENTYYTHAITVTGVVYDKNNKLVGFYIHDTGVWMTRYISIEEFKYITHYDDNENKKTGVYATIVKDPIKAASNNINATGTNYSNIIYGNSGNNIIKGLGGKDFLYGKDGNDAIYGGSGNDEIYGGEGADKLYGDSGDDIIYGDSGNDIIYGGAGKDTIYGGEGDNEIHGGSENDTIYGGEDDDTIYGDGGNDTIYGYNGENKIHGGSGNDTIYGGEDNDIIYGDAGKDTIYGDAGNDEIHGGSGNDIIYGDAGNDTIYGDAGNDTIYGGDGCDIIDAGSGNDNINGGKGNDTIYCGAGNDKVVFDLDCGDDIIYSASGSITLDMNNNLYTDWKNFELSISSENPIYSDLLIKYGDNSITFKNFYSNNRNKCQTLYLIDSSETKYRYLTTSAKGKVKVGNTNGNNVFFITREENNTITTGKYSDIVYMQGGNDTITYTGGKDYYISDAGDNTYTINKFDKNTKLTVSDKTGSDNMIFKFDKSKLYLFINYNEDGIRADDNLYIYNKDYISSLSDYSSIFSNNTTGYVCIEDYFGEGKIENISTKSGKKYIELDITNTINVIQENVVKWFNNNEGYDSVLDAISNNAENINDLISAYTTDIQIKQI